MKHVILAILACALAGCGEPASKTAAPSTAAPAGAELPDSPTSARIASLAEAYGDVPEDNAGGGNVDTYVPADVWAHARDLDWGLAERASSYPSYVIQMELCGVDAGFVLDDFQRRLDARGLSDADRQMYTRILATGRAFHESFFRNEVANGYKSLSTMCPDSTADRFRELMNDEGIWNPPYSE